jgi:hypothetical protein
MTGTHPRCFIEMFGEEEWTSLKEY